METIMRNAPVSGNDTGLPADAFLELHDSIALALDAVSCPSPSLQNLSEARVYLRDALRQIGSAA